MLELNNVIRLSENGLDSILKVFIIYLNSLFLI